MGKFNKLRFASIVVILAIINIILFTVVDIILFAAIGKEPTEIMPYFFGFWGCEVVVLAAKRIFVKDSPTTTTTKSGSTVVTTKVEAKG